MCDAHAYPGSVSATPVSDGWVDSASSLEPDARSTGPRVVLCARSSWQLWSLHSMNSSRVILCLIFTGKSTPPTMLIHAYSFSLFSIDYVFTVDCYGQCCIHYLLRPHALHLCDFDFRLPNISPSVRLAMRQRHGEPLSASHLVLCGTPASSRMQPFTIPSSSTSCLLYPYASPSCKKIPDSSGMYPL